MKSHEIGKAVLTGNRRGAVLVTVMLVLLVLSVLACALVRSALRREREARREQDRVQAAWLAESGLERAAARLSRSSDYSGETWTVSAAELGGSDGGSVAIAVVEVPDHPHRRRVTARADYPDDPTRRARQRREAIVDLDPNPDH